MDREKIRNKNALVPDSRKMEYLVNTMIFQTINAEANDENNYRVHANALQIKELVDLRSLLRANSMKPNVDLYEDKQDFSEKYIQPNNRCNFMLSLNAVLSCCYFDSDIKVSHIASSLAMSERKLNRKLKHLLNISPGAYIRKFRLDKARILLSRGGAISHVAYDVGFNSHAYFSRCFKAEFGLLPSEYQNGF